MAFLCNNVAGNLVGRPLKVGSPLKYTDNVSLAEHSLGIRNR